MRVLKLNLTMKLFYGAFLVAFLLILTRAFSQAEDAPADLACAPAAHFNVASPGVSVSCRTGLLVIETDGVPVHEVGGQGRHQMRAHDQTFYIPLSPQIASEPSEIPVLGPIAITVTGVVIFSPNTAPDFNWSDAVAIGLLDDCNGHVSPHGHYHYHGAPACPFDSEGEGEAWEGEGGVKLIGYAFDGFPILRDRAQTSSW